MSWFNFTGSNPSNPAHYTLLPGTPSCNAPTQQMCALQAMNDGAGNPVITDALKNEIINSLQNQVNGVNVNLKTR
ncbi:MULTISPECIES: hypothetical protein [Sphingobacterium]|uniref:hypothetical protein n=1 Tax=Sphingobacterium TaxID=28453 RepID=UPI0010523236|nr:MULTISPECIES: hypothetical protein [Sphingobacterium]MCW2259597.1 hypothetical protein [Sphingobacterium kitahiroshimense]TCR13961.1 hypothetical protein EDF67_10164 [Sphingobacterium sp. JUb78]